MLNTLHIKNYKGLRDFRIESLGRVNLLLGKNNVGKSSILEAVDLYSSRFDLAHIIQLLALRSDIESGGRFFDSVIYDRRRR